VEVRVIVEGNASIRFAMPFDAFRVAERVLLEHIADAVGLPLAQARFVIAESGPDPGDGSVTLAVLALRAADPPPARTAVTYNATREAEALNRAIHRLVDGGVNWTALSSAMLVEATLVNVTYVAVRYSPPMDVPPPTLLSLSAFAAAFLLGAVLGLGALFLLIVRVYRWLKQHSKDVEPIIPGEALPDTLPDPRVMTTDGRTALAMRTHRIYDSLLLGPVPPSLWCGHPMSLHTPGIVGTPLLDAATAKPIGPPPLLPRVPARRTGGPMGADDSSVRVDSALEPESTYAFAFDGVGPTSATL